MVQKPQRYGGLEERQADLLCAVTKQYGYACITILGEGTGEGGIQSKEEMAKTGK